MLILETIAFHILVLRYMYNNNILSIIKPDSLT